MMHGDRERQRRKAQQQVGKQPNDGSFDGAFGSRDYPTFPAHARALPSWLARWLRCQRVLGNRNDHWISGLISGPL